MNFLFKSSYGVDVLLSEQRTRSLTVDRTSCGSFWITRSNLVRESVMLELRRVVSVWLNHSGGSIVQNSGSLAATLARDSVGAEALLSVMMACVLESRSPVKNVQSL